MKFLKPETSNLKPAEGFSLLELIVVMGIVAILTSILAGYSRQSSTQLILSSKEAQILNLISRAKLLSIETFFQEIGSQPTPLKICAYGIHVDTTANEVFIFQDRMPEATGCGSSDNSYNSSDDARLTSELDVVKINPETLALSGTLQDVVYIPPDPDVVINNNDAKKDASIKVDLVSGSRSFIINVYKSGQVSVQ